MQTKLSEPPAQHDPHAAQPSLSAWRNLYPSHPNLSQLLDELELWVVGTSGDDTPFAGKKGGGGRKLTQFEVACLST